MMELLEDVFIRCSRCGKVTGIHKEDFDFESYVYDRGDNRMGEEIEFRHEGYIECDQCDRLYKCKLADAISPHATGNSTRLPMDQRNYEGNTNRLSFLCCYTTPNCKCSLHR